MFVREVLVLLFLTVISTATSSRILAVFLAPVTSHQTAFRPLTQALAKRGHNTVVVTAEPAFPEGGTPENLTEIDIRIVSYKVFGDTFNESSDKKMDRIYEQTEVIYKAINRMFPIQIKEEKVRKIIEENYDLLIVEPAVNPTIGLVYKIKTPMILVSSFGSVFDHYQIIGSSSHPLLHPIMTQERVYDLSIWEKIKALYNHFQLYLLLQTTENISNDILKAEIDEAIPSLDVLKDDVEMLFVNVQPVLDDCPAVPLGMVYMTDLEKYPSKKVQEDLKNYLDASKNGAIYVSLGTMVKPYMLPPGLAMIFMETFSKLPYDIVMKWYTEDIPGKPANVKIAKWFPQVDILRHPKVKLFITQAGLQSTLEAIAAKVPLIGLPVFYDQWHNAEKYAHRGIGLKLDVKQLTVNLLKEAIDEVMGNKRYQDNIARLRLLMTDLPQSPLERTVWWTEYVLRHGGARHLRSPAANLPWTQYFEIELFTILLAFLVVILLSMYFILRFVIRLFYCKVYHQTVIKKNRRN